MKVLLGLVQSCERLHLPYCAVLCCAVLGVTNINHVGKHVLYEQRCSLNFCCVVLLAKVGCLSMESVVILECSKTTEHDEINAILRNLIVVYSYEYEMIRPRLKTYR